MITKGELLRLTRVHLDFSQTKMAKLMRIKRRHTVGDMENGEFETTYQRMCQVYVIYCKFGVQCKQLDTLFNNYIEKMFKE
ncbi:MAG: hypothetical protein GY928_08085 [Colwellia sp.]|nr:hypothetical protein [Colwellia sp.]